MNENGRWVTMNGVHVFIKDGQSPMDAFIRQKVQNEIPNKLSELEYNALCEEFADNLTDEEKELIKLYSTNPAFAGSMYANQITNKNENKWKYYKIKENNDIKEIYLNMNDIYEMKEFYEDINEKYDYDWMKMMQKNQKQFDDLFEKKGISLDKDFIVYRKGHESLEDLQNGVIRYGYTSTSAKSRINKQTPGGLKLGENEFEIIVPKGMKFLPIKNLVPEDVKSQNEIVLPRKIKFDFIEDKTIKGDFNIKKYAFDKDKNKYVVKAKRS